MWEAFHGFQMMKREWAVKVNCPWCHFKSFLEKKCNKNTAPTKALNKHLQPSELQIDHQQCGT